MAILLACGVHSSERDATLRLRGHLETSRPPEHFVRENVLLTSLGRLGLTEEAHVQAVRQKYTETEAMVRQFLSSPRYVFTGNVHPYGLKVLKMLRAANTDDHPVDIQSEPFCEEAARLAYRAMGFLTLSASDSLADLRRKREGYVGFYNQAQAVREHALVDFLAGLHAQFPNDRILMDLGTNHNHLDRLLNARGVPATSQTLPNKLPTLLTVLDNHILKGLQGAELPSAVPLEQLWRRVLIGDALTLGKTHDEIQAALVVNKLSDAHVDDLYGHLDQAGRDVPTAALAWLRDRKLL